MSRWVRPGTVCSPGSVGTKSGQLGNVVSSAEFGHQRDIRPPLAGFQQVRELLKIAFVSGRRSLEEHLRGLVGKVAEGVRHPGWHKHKCPWVASHIALSLRG